MRHQHAAQLRWSDPDMLGHLDHARALSLAEDGRVVLCADAICVAFDYDGDVSRPFEYDEREFWVTFQDDLP